ncbi:MAG: glycosyltransferase family 2 protein [Planctomycetes bacterium]|nr:glycosyltransferase family 2 protein [Planctomycetota bacterium]
MRNRHSAFTVSVIVPTHNRAGLLERALRSVDAQSRPPDELIVVDDGSTDDTERRVRDLWPGAVYLRQEHRGVSAARNRGIEASSCAWVAFLDSDDDWLPRKLERQIAALEAAPGFRICHTDEIWIRRGRRVNPMRKHAKAGGDIFERCLPLCAISPSSAMISRSVLEEVGLFDESFPVCEDYDLWLRICSRMPVLYVDEMLVVKHGGHADQLSRSYPAMDRYRIRALEKILREGLLAPAQRIAVIGALREKISIYAAGARKRGREDEAEEMERKLEGLLWR